MAKDVERLVLELSADVSRLERGLKTGQNATLRATRNIERQFDTMNKRTSRSVSDMGSNIRQAIAGIALGVAVREVQQYADAWTRMENPLRAAGMSQGQVNDRMNDLVGISLRSRSSLEGTVTLYNRLIATSGELGVSQERVARVVETVNKALATSNMTGGERQSAMVQLAQGLGSGTLAGDELKAIRENSVVLAQAIADEFDTTIGGLKKLGAEGKLTSERVFRAIEVAQSGVDAAFARTTATVADSFTNLQTRAMQFVGQLDDATGASEKFAAMVGFVGNNLEAFADAAVVAATVVGGVLAGRAVAAAVLSFTALQASIAITNAQLIAFEVTSGLATGSLGRLTLGATAAAGASRGLSAALALVGGPIGIAVAAIATAFVGLAMEINAAKVETERYNSILKENAEVLADAAALSGAVGDQSAGAVAGIDAMCDATTRLSDETWELVDAQKEAIRTRLANAIDAVREERRQIGGNSLRRGVAETLGRVGIGAGDAPTQARLDRLDDDYAALMSRYLDLTIVQNNERRRTPRGSGGGGGDGGGSGGGRSRASGPTPAELAAMREQLALQMALDKARATSDEAEEKRVQRLLDIRALTEQMTRAQVANAEALAIAQVDAIIAGEATAKQIDELIAASERRTEARVEAEAALSAEMDRQLQVQIALARIEGNDRVVLMLERELQLRQALNALGPTATPEQRAAVRGDEAMLNRAEDRAIVSDQGKEMARNFVDIIRADDIGTELGNRFRAAAFDKIEEVLGNLFSQMMGGGPQGGAGGGVGGWIQAAASIFGGGRALGGPVKGGMAYRVNENTPNSEYFVPKSDGWVGNIRQPRGGQRTQQNITVRNELYLAGANGDAVIYANVRRMLDQSQRQTVAAVKAGAPSAQLEQQLLRE